MIVDVIDELGRSNIRDLQEWNNSGKIVPRTHGYSYLYAKRMFQQTDENKFLNGFMKNYQLLPIQLQLAYAKFNDIKTYLQSHQQIDEFTASDRTRGRWVQWFMAHYEMKKVIQ